MWAKHEVNKNVIINEYLGMKQSHPWGGTDYFYMKFFICGWFRQCELKLFFPPWISVFLYTLWHYFIHSRIIEPPIKKKKLQRDMLSSHCHFIRNAKISTSYQPPTTLTRNAILMILHKTSNMRSTGKRHSKWSWIGRVRSTHWELYGDKFCKSMEFSILKGDMMCNYRS